MGDSIREFEEFRQKMNDRIMESGNHRRLGARSVRGRSSQVVGVRALSKTGQLGHDGCPASTRMIKLLKHQHGGSFTEHEPVPVQIEGP